jgi:hypothetical protein
VKDKLKAPSTASFASSKADKLNEKEWSVSGTVDAQNTFGAKLRTRWRCKAKYAGDGQWETASALDE